VADGAVTSAIDEAISNAGARKPAQAGQSHELATHHGSTSSWIAVTIIVIGFVVGGVAMLIGPTWWVFWLGTGIVVVGGIIALSSHILDDWY
jgi:hypothetical protein